MTFLPALISRLAATELRTHLPERAGHNLVNAATTFLIGLMDAGADYAALTGACEGLEATIRELNDRLGGVANEVALENLASSTVEKNLIGGV